MQNTSPKIGLALGGGGARALAHIPLLEAFDELGLQPDLIVGCSMGAVIGAGYASGMTGVELRQHTEQLLSNRIEFFKHIFGTRKFKPKDLLSMNSLTSLHLDGESLADVALPNIIPANIEDTKIRLKIVATNYSAMEEHVFTTGPLLKALGATIAIPGIIVSPRFDGDIYVDGAVLNPVPHSHAHDGTDIVIASDVTGKPRNDRKGSMGNLDLAIGTMLIMFNQTARLRRELSPADLYLEPAVDQFGTGEFFKYREIFDATQIAKDLLKRKLELFMSTNVAL